MSKNSLAIIALLSVSLVGMAIVAHMNLGRDVGRIVYNTCQESRMSSTIGEKKCGELQDKYKYEYICKEANTSSTNDCWVESNDQIGQE